jgi:DNA-binding FadR family transcriptional regulator|tara:strand:+ start:1003 stop:1203 length:201 start_codon:yes stop_codon:yes gene_type:complete
MFDLRLLNKLPPFLEGYEAIARAIATGDTDHAFDLARQLHKSAQPLKKEALAVFDRHEELRGGLRE